MPESLNEFIVRQILSFPELTENRTDVLHEALCVFPSGFVWQNGVLTDHSDKVKSWKPITFEQFVKWDYIPSPEARADSTVARKELKAAWEDEQSKIPYYETIVANARDLAMVNDGLRSSDYPYGHPKHVEPEFARENPLSCLLSAPNWIADEWEEAYEMMRFTAKQHGWRL